MAKLASLRHQWRPPDPVVLDMAVRRRRQIERDDGEMPPDPFEGPIAPEDAAMWKHGPAILRPAGLHDHWFQHTNDAPAEWIADIRHYSPVSEDKGWLELYWEPGEWWIPCQRWTAYEMVHVSFYPADEDQNWELLSELNGPHPRSEGHMCVDLNTIKRAEDLQQYPCLCRRKTSAWRGGPCSLITLAQWRLWRRWNKEYVPIPFWVIQGAHGGHKFAFNSRERELLQMEGAPTDPPSPSELPYAPYDNRVKDQMIRYNKLLAMGVSIAEFREQMGEGYGRYSANIARELRRQHIKFLGEQLGDVTDMFTKSSTVDDMRNQPRTEVDYEKLEEANEAHYIDTGRVLTEQEMHNPTKVSLNQPLKLL